MSGEHSNSNGTLRFRDGRNYSPFFEFLEGRVLLSAVVEPSFVVLPQAVHDAAKHPAVTNPNPVGLTPTQLRHAYGFDQISGNGAGQTIAIVDAFDQPNISSDLQKFDSTYGLSNNDSTGKFALTKVTMSRRTIADAGWGLEISLDVEWAHAIAPGAHILLVEAASNSFSALLSAVDYARSQSGVVAVSMSWGGGEFASETGYDYHFTTPAGHAKEVFVAASGDTGGQLIYPAASPNVVAVGGTTLHVDSAGNYLSETGWSGSGGGISAFESKPTYQSGVTLSATKRTAPDVAYDADPNTGFGVYDTLSYSGQSGWFQVGGTSAGAPQWSALIAIADQVRGSAGPLGSSFLTDVYNLPSGDFHDIVSGNAGSFSAASGYDLVTGLGSPRGNLVVSGLQTAPAIVIAGAALPGETVSQTAAGTAGTKTDSVREIGICLRSSTPADSQTLSSSVAAASTSASDTSTDADMLSTLIVDQPLSDDLLGELVSIL